MRAFGKGSGAVYGMRRLLSSSGARPRYGGIVEEIYSAGAVFSVAPRGGGGVCED